MFDSLACRDQSSITYGSFLGLFEYLRTLLEHALHACACLAREFLAENLADLFETGYLVFGLFEMLRKTILDLGGRYRFYDFGKCADDLFLGRIKVLQLVDQWRSCKLSRLIVCTF